MPRVGRSIVPPPVSVSIMQRIRKSGREKVEGITPEDLARVNDILRDIGGPNVVWGSKDILDVWIAESRMEAERRSAHRLVIATWALAGMTFVLVLVTVGLIVATVTHA